jgi:hypothetical protein
MGPIKWLVLLPVVPGYTSVYRRTMYDAITCCYRDSVRCSRPGASPKQWKFLVGPLLSATDPTKLSTVLVKRQPLDPTTPGGDVLAQ